jgi:hypothetical protein
MGLGFLLPWERLPPWLLGLILAVSAVFLAFNAELYSWRQAEMVVFSFIGLGIFSHEVRKLRAKPVAEVTVGEE